MTVKQNLCPKSKYSIKCPYTMEPEFIVVHNTANDATAANEISYMISNSNKVSFHYAVDNKNIVQGILENRNAWHAGDGSSGEGNRKGIGVEICFSKSGGAKFDEAEKLAAKFIAFKLNERKWGIEKVKKHQDFNGKYCPHRTLDRGWQRFLDMISAELKTYDKEPETVTVTLHVLEYGSKYDGEIATIQAIMNHFDKAGISVNGRFDEATVRAVKKYQEKRRFPVNGTWGEREWIQSLTK